MNKLIRLLCFFCLLLLIIFYGKVILERIKIFNMLKKKYFITIFNTKSKKAKIVIFNGKDKIFEFNAEYATDILSVENENIFYFELESYYKDVDTIIEKSFVVKYDIKNNKIIEKIPFPFIFKNKMPYMKKIENNVYFSVGNRLNSNIKENESVLYSYNLKTEEIKEILTYNGQGLPVIKENEIIYSKENKIYSFNKFKNISEFLFDGDLPFDYVDGEIYYMKKNNIVKRSKKNSDKIISKINKKTKIGGYPVKINDNLFAIIELKPIPLDKLYSEYGEIEIIDSKSKSKLSLYKLYYEKETHYPYLTNSSFIFVDKISLQKYLNNKM